MKVVLQDIRSGRTYLESCPFPQRKAGHVTIQNKKSLISPGTERMLVEFGKASVLEKVRSQPDKVKMVLDKVKTDGLAPTYESVQAKLDQPIALGYSSVGVVIDGSDTGFPVGTRVVTNGNHAEVVRAPKNLVADVPDGVDDESASFTVLGSIALQGIRLIDPTLGECVVVIGLGLIGLLAVQILRANGCHVLAIDFDSSKCALARDFGAEVVDLSNGEDPLAKAMAFSKGRGVDAVLITASSKSNDVVHQAAAMSRKRGRIILVGVVGLELRRSDFYEKELTFQVSCSYGPGRYDDEYEAKGHDYPHAFVRWTQNRNFEAVLGLMATGAIQVRPLITHRYPLNDARQAYEKLDDQSSLGIVLDYLEASDEPLSRTTVEINTVERKRGRGTISFIGAGNYASRTLIPAFKDAGATLFSIVASGGLSAVQHGKKNAFTNASTDINAALDNNTDAVVIATQHNLHASQVILALENRKHVFVEKPLALNHHDVDAIEIAQRSADTILMVGYNRRFAPHVQKMKTLLDRKSTPKTFIMTMNAGEIPADHWTQDPAVGGGRIVGEACHYIDLMRFLAGSKITSFNAVKMGENECVEISEDKAIITLGFEDGSVGSIHYFANGGKSFPKERIEVFCDGGVLQLNNFRSLKGYGWKGFNKANLWSQDKGQVACSKAFMDAVKGGSVSPIPLEEIFEVARVTIDIVRQIRT